MQVLTRYQVRQLQTTVAAIYNAAEILEDRTCVALDWGLCVLTSDRAIAGYRLLWYVGKNVAQISWMLLVLAWTLLREWGDRIVSDCLVTCETATDTAVQPDNLSEMVTCPDPWELPAEPMAIAPELPTPAPTLYLLPPARETMPTLPQTIRELRALCRDRGIKGAGRWTKDQCLEALTA